MSTRVRTLRLVVAYDGADFAGWQRQAGQRTVQGELEAVLAAIEGAPVHVAGAGRTDAGVHAAAQVASIRLSRDRLPPTGWCAPSTPRCRPTCGCSPPRRCSTAFTPGCTPAARPIATSSGTRRWIIRRCAGWPGTCRSGCRSPAMAEAAAVFVGEHDFAAFQGQGSRVRSTVRRVTSVTVDADAALPGWCDAVDERGRLLCVEVVGRRLPAPHGARHGRHHRAGGPGPDAPRGRACGARPGHPCRRRPDRAGPRAAPLARALHVRWAFARLVQPHGTRAAQGVDSVRRRRRGADPAGDSRTDPAPRRHHHGRQRPVGGATAPAARRGPSRRHRRGARHRGDLGQARPRGAHPVRVLGRELEAAGCRSERADGAAAPLPAARARHAAPQRHPLPRHRPAERAARRRLRRALRGGEQDPAQRRHAVQHRAELRRPGRDRRCGAAGDRSRRVAVVARRDAVSPSSSTPPASRIPISSSAPAARCGSATSCSGRSPTPRSG